MDKEKLIINLIKDSLTNMRLIEGLKDLGIDASNYYLRLNDTIFELLNIDADNDELFEEYLDWCNAITNVEIFKYPELLDTYAARVYMQLIKEKKE